MSRDSKGLDDADYNHTRDSKNTITALAALSAAAAGSKPAAAAAVVVVPLNADDDDDEVFTVELDLKDSPSAKLTRRQLKLSAFVTAIVERFDEKEKKITLLVNAPNKVHRYTGALPPVAQYLRTKNGVRPEALQRPIATTNLVDSGASQDDVDFAAALWNGDRRLFGRVFHLAFYMQIDSLVELLGGYICSLIKGKPQNQVARILYAYGPSAFDKLTVTKQKELNQLPDVAAAPVAAASAAAGRVGGGGGGGMNKHADVDDDEDESGTVIQVPIKRMRQDTKAASSSSSAAAAAGGGDRKDEKSQTPVRRVAAAATTPVGAAAAAATAAGGAIVPIASASAKGPTTKK